MLVHISISLSIGSILSITTFFSTVQTSDTGTQYVYNYFQVCPELNFSLWTVQITPSNFRLHHYILHITFLHYFILHCTLYCSILNCYTMHNTRLSTFFSLTQKYLGFFNSAIINTQQYTIHLTITGYEHWYYTILHNTDYSANCCNVHWKVQ